MTTSPNPRFDDTSRLYTVSPERWQRNVFLADAAADQETIKLLHGAFEYFIDYQHGGTAPEYFWFRKRKQVLRLVERHYRTLGNVRHSNASPWRAMDLGCGDGVDFFLIRRKILELNSGASLSFIGVDGNPESLRMCELKKVYYDASDSDFVRCDFSDSRLPFADGTIDFVYCSEVLEH